MKLKTLFKSLVPSRLMREVRLARIRRALFHDGREGALIQSVRVSPRAALDRTSEIGDGVFIGDGVRVGRHSYIHSGSEVLSAEIGNFCSIGRVSGSACSSIQPGTFPPPADCICGF